MDEHLLDKNTHKSLTLIIKITYYSRELVNVLTLFACAFRNQTVYPLNTYIGKFNMIVIVIPAFNEEKSLKSLFSKIGEVFKNIEYKIIVCNDGSTDQTGKILSELAQNFPMTILEHSINRGLGETVRDLFEAAAAMTMDNDVIVRLECDDTHEPKYILDMVAKVQEGNDVVVASRFQPGGSQHGVTGFRAWLSKCANLYMRVVFNIKGLKEYSCGFRAYNAAIIKKAIAVFGNNFIQLKGLGFTCTLEKLIKMKILGARFAEVPFSLRYDQKQSDSKMVTSVTTLGYLILALLYHWPWGGWRRAYKKQLKEQQCAV